MELRWNDLVRVRMEVATPLSRAGPSPLEISRGSSARLSRQQTGEPASRLRLVNCILNVPAHCSNHNTNLVPKSPCLALHPPFRRQPHHPPTMRLSEDLLSLSALLSLSSLTWAINLDCKDVRVDKQSFDLSVLGGPHTVHWIQETPPSLSNFTFTIDICKALRRTKGVPKDNECPTGTRGKACQPLWGIFAMRLDHTWSI